MTAWQDFLSASRLTTATQERLASRISEFDPTPPPVERLARRAAPLPLPRRRSRLRQLSGRRRSERALAEGTLALRDLAGLFSGLVDTPDGRRPWAAAGALHSCTVFLHCLRGEPAIEGRLWQLDPTAPGLVEVGPCSPAEELVPLVVGDPAAATPAGVLVVVGDHSRLEAKYGERAGRFLLLEAGAVLHALGLGAAEAGLQGHQAGGWVDDYLLAPLLGGLRPAERADFSVLGTYLVSPRRRRQFFE